ncbi:MULTISPECIES: nitroreductase family protein [Halocynthiibacter]|uniref:Nitroreductase family protein n=1 Tax=Halocynthiibacter halioticoli TaxID=2986804 RepID=A0AAE3J1R3_9RHOB|nr:MULTISPECIES: nitroreductase family protein [Halocynthiibacter]MCV6823577.1 nitroreductase family protein [Halocynthiibacter halioticoli]MCW4056578.1 nitroreductase family protein [Halocynthiibacter sp. SDUM655004]
MKTLVKSILPESQLDRLRDARLRYRSSGAARLASSAHTSGLKIASQAKPLASAYYSLLSWRFQREERAVLLGRAKYHAELQENDANIFLMRRNVHRIEKGLLMQPRRPVFAKDYILETVNVYRKLVAEPSRSEESTVESLHWAYDVLNTYFGAVAPDPVLDLAREAFEKCPVPKDTCTGSERVPYKRNLDEKPVSFEQFERLAVLRRSVRWFEQKPVPRELLDKAFTVAGLSPSACNRQPFRFLVFDDPETVSTVASLPGGTAGFKHNIPVIVAIVGTLDAFYSERDRHVIYIDGSLAAMSFNYALETLGLSSCIFNWPDVEKNEKRAEKVLGLEGYERPIFFMGVGYPDPNAMVAYSQKRPLDVMRQYNPPINPE